MELRPIISSLRHHALTAALLTLQVALTCAIVCNVAFMIARRIQQVSIPTGIAENELSVIRSHGTGTDDNAVNAVAQHQTDLAALRAIPGVRSVAAVSYALPLNRQDGFGLVCTTPQLSLHSKSCQISSFYDGTPHLIDTLGLHLTAGRDFRSDEFVSKDNDHPHVVIISRALADRLYPGQDAVGKMLYMGRGPNALQVIGIVADLLRPRLRGPGQNHLSLITSQLPNSNRDTYVLRSAPTDRERILQAATKALFKTDPTRILDPKYVRTFTQIRAAYFQRDTTMIGLFVASALGLLFVTALGIAGLANFWVQQRRRSIGIRRAVGATRKDILRYFQTENFLIVTTGVVLGMALAVTLNLQLMKHYELPRLPLWYLPIGALALEALGQMAVFFPARRASRVPPLEAIRGQ
ncbi:ABC transporter permease [Dyella sp. A6]|uniref:ABC transporter permease n=1 Tax=Dyella aluminiiresistens TaxID=3069105 RepID=UPI002E7A56F2|nr:FtsX-like permease family protein [Dyella sp. A6]